MASGGGPSGLGLVFRGQDVSKKPQERLLPSSFLLLYS